MRYAIVVLAAALSTAWGQELKMPPGLDKLAAKATESVDVTLDSSLLQLAGNFLSAKDADQAKAKKIISGVKSIMVRSFEFAKAGEYSEADVEAVRAQLRPPAWSRIVSARSSKDGDNAEVYLRTGGGQIGGMAVIAAEPKELTIVYIDGAIRPEDLVNLEGNFGIPKLGIGKKTGDARKTTGKDDEE
jgi:hypothetical protein